MYSGGHGPDSNSLESNAREVAQNYSQGSKIQVYVPPEKPGQAFIKPRKTDDPWIMMGVGFLFSAVGAYQLLGGLY